MDLAFQYLASQFQHGGAKGPLRNVDGTILDAVPDNLALHAGITFCGAAARVRA
jgi:NADPH-dependent curcumin reductase CurA